MIKLERPACPDAIALQSNYKAPANKAALIAACFDKCMYCESKVSHIYFGDVEHIRPKDSHGHLEFEWTNLGFVCARCNNEKRNKWFPTTPFVDPFVDDPNDHLGAFGPVIWHVGGSERGEITHREINLNRPELYSRRHERLLAFRDAVDRAYRTQDAHLRALALRALEESLTDDHEYAMAHRALWQTLKRH